MLNLLISYLAKMLYQKKTLKDLILLRKYFGDIVKESVVMQRQILVQSSRNTTHQIRFVVLGILLLFEMKTRRKKK